MGVYLLLYSGGRLPETAEETEVVTDAWGTWLAGIGDALLDGNPFASNARSLSPDTKRSRWPGAAP